MSKIDPKVKETLISVIVPTFNESKRITECIYSLYSQNSRFKIEIIVVDDGSTDNTQSKVKALFGKIKNLSFYQQTHKGPGEARNLGASKARGTVLVFVDADMKFDNNFVRKLTAPILNGKVIGTDTQEEYLANAENYWAKNWSIGRYFAAGIVNKLYVKNINPNKQNHGGIFRAIRKDVFQKVNGFDKTGEYTDDETLARKTGNKAVNTKGAIIYHYNPDTLHEVWERASWIGSGKNFAGGPIKTLYTLFMFSLPISFLKSIIIASKFKQPFFVPFKLIYDSAIWTNTLKNLIYNQFKRNYYFLVYILLVGMFSFWFLLSKNNYFHMDDWEYIGRYNLGFWKMITTPFFGMFNPLNIATYYLQVRLFGLEYITLQTLLVILHVINAFMVFKIISHTCKKHYLAILGMVLFGISSVSIDSLVWTMGINFVQASTCILVSYYAFLKYSESSKNIWLAISVVAGFLAPLFRTITILFPFAFAFLAFIDVKKSTKFLTAGLYAVSGLLNVIIAWQFVAQNPIHGPQISMVQKAFSIITYMAIGILKGTVFRFFLPELYFLKNLTHYTSTLRTVVYITILSCGIVAAARLFINRRKYIHEIWSLGKYSVLIMTPYLAIAPFRIINSLDQASIPRYSYLSLAFLIILLATILSRNAAKWKLPIILISIAILSLQFTSIINFNANWRLNTEKDRSLIEDTLYLLNHNREVYDIPITGIWSHLSISQLSFISNQQNTFIKTKLNEADIPKLQTDIKSKQIYQKFFDTYSLYNPLFLVPYSM